MAPRRKKRRATGEETPTSEADSAEEDFRCVSILPPSKPVAKQTEQVRLKRKALYPARVWVIEDFLSATECTAWIAYAQRTGFSPVKHEATPYVAFRDNGRIEFEDERLAARIWQRLSRLVQYKEAVGCHAKIRVYRYERGQKFGRHIDESNDIDGTRSTGATVLIYLNGDMKGGETVFYSDHAGRHVAVAFAPKRGALLFHGHGEQCLTHEAMEVREGVKYVLRTDIVFQL